MEAGKKKLRHEIKYFISYYDYVQLRTRLHYLIKRDKNSISEAGYHIRSLYFDNSSDVALHEKNWGVYRRDKYRIRIYNGSEKLINLERKSKYGDLIRKDSYSLTRKDYEKIMNNDVDFLKSTNNELAQDFYIKYVNGKMEPKIIVDYVREAYVYKYGNVRVTFDKGLMAGVNSFDIFDSKLVTVHAIHTKSMILEIKFDEYIPTHIRNLLQLDSHNRSAISKYVICREEGMKYYNH